ncbi:glycosyltransferase family 2 protein [Tropicimonas sp. S265A]|uniref:glycosyltransferase family 2 protein n=1 Tax=Tropicimonas sp. S265A TaxID=3415134 RepID=UPI003C7B58D4
MNVPQLQRRTDRVTTLFARPEPRARARTPLDKLLSHLIETGRISEAERLQAGHLARVHQVAIPDTLVAEGWLTEADLLAARCACFSATHIQLSISAPDATLVHEVGLQWCLRHRLLPWRRLGGRVVCVTSEPEYFDQIVEDLPPEWGQPLLGVASAAEIEQAFVRGFGPELVQHAETRLEAAASCRTWTAPQAVSVLLASACVAFCLVVAPQLALSALLFVAFGAVAANVIFKALLTGAALRAAPSPPPATTDMALPRISLLVPLLREAEVASTLLNNLERLKYPRGLLEVLFIVEANDDLTKSTLSRLSLLQSFRVIDVPPGTIQTKPRALNFALHFCRGEIIGIYDAEDKPEPEQLLKVAEGFRQHGPEVACLQGRLDFFNSGANMLTRCFTIEYATWFGLQLRGLARLGLPLPLGGTTLFMRRDALDRVGCWDAHNVTEDADLGIRLHRAGYRTALIDTVTDEEATSRAWPWVRQRSRWIKGFIMTYIVHMRSPRTLWRDLGPLGFATFQCLFLASVLGALTMPLLILMLGATIGLSVPGLSDAMVRVVGLSFLGLEVINLAVWAAGIRARRHRHLFWAIPLLHIYFLLASVAALKATIELVARPFFWDKTTHGISRPPPSC